ncbi:hypothetical protein [Pseudoalteromonas maricaloris]|uniref:Uncharacterized protein n=1 Tax=Pseudoalteromonas maricaloris TaxID=184924 RepID=A0A8I2KPU6_9GAMM|nr:hypothetical protein [Pseudoalteromonas maricaloris]NLR24261.1 hypothetical protein [Pseudoalteromonas maricaloris]WOX26896.1 hypothetical protein R5H13_09455 [Pseudoalteromonas maricaloris]
MQTTLITDSNHWTRQLKIVRALKSKHFPKKPRPEPVAEPITEYTDMSALHSASYWNKQGVL